MAHWQQFAHKPQTKKLKFCKKKRKMKEITHQCQQKGSSSLIPWKVIGRTITGPYPKLLQPWLIKLLIELLMDFSAKWETSDRLIWHHVALCPLSEIKEQKFFRGANTAQQPRWTTHCTTTKVNTLHVNCLKVQSRRAARKKRAKNSSFQSENTFKREKGRKFFRVNQLCYHHKHYVLHEFFWLADCAEGIIKVEINTKSTYSSYHTVGRKDNPKSGRIHSHTKYKTCFKLEIIFPRMTKCQNNGCDKNASLTISHSTLSHPPLSDVGWPRSTHAKISSCSTVSISSAVSKAVSISSAVYIHFTHSHSIRTSTSTTFAT